MIEPTDQDIVHALRLADYLPNRTPAEVRTFAHAGWKWAKNCLAHARTIAKLRIATEAFERISNGGDFPSLGRDVAMSRFAKRTLTQIKD